MTSPSRTLTFGVEYEFLLGSIRVGKPHPLPTDGRTSYFPSSFPDYSSILSEQESNSSNPDPEDASNNFIEQGACAAIVARTLRENGIPAYPWYRGGASRYKAELTNRDFRGWGVKVDASVQHWKPAETFNPWWPKEDWRNDPCAWHGLEVVSPILRRGFTRNDEIDDEALREAEKVADLLQKNFRCFINRNCGLHVHVGDDRNGFQIGTLQKLIGFLYTSEPGIEKLHPMRRYDLKTAKYCKPLRSRMPDQIRNIHGNDVLDIIFSQPSLGDLGRVVDSWKTPKEHHMAA